MATLPEILRHIERADIEIAPPGELVAGLMQLSVMTTAEWNGEFVAHFKAEASRLGKSQMVRISRLTSTDEAGLGSDKF